jgi:hypothetical protein
MAPLGFQQHHFSSRPPHQHLQGQALYAGGIVAMILWYDPDLGATQDRLWQELNLPVLGKPRSTQTLPLPALRPALRMAPTRSPRANPNGSPRHSGTSRRALAVQHFVSAPPQSEVLQRRHQHHRVQLKQRRSKSPRTLEEAQQQRSCKVERLETEVWNSLNNILYPLYILFKLFPLF